MKEFTNLAEDMVVGNPLDPKTKVGAIVSQQHMDKILSYVEIARSEGATIKCGGERILTKELKNGFFVRPTVITKYD